MYAVIAGAGEVGYQVARSLYKEGYNVAIIENDPVRADHAESLDALIIRGNAASPAKLEEAGIETADLFIAVTGSDEVNMIGCAHAKSKGVRTIARVNALDYINEPISTDTLTSLGIDVGICPELVTAIKMAKLLTLPSLTDVTIFAKGLVQVIETRLDKKSPLANNPIKDMKFPEECNLVAIIRGDEIIIPGGSDKLRVNDKMVFAVGNADILPELENLIEGTEEVAERETSPMRKVMIIGATRIGIHLSRLLEKEGEVILLDEDEETCHRASEQLTSSLVIHGSGTDESVLAEEGIAEVDAFVATTYHEELNILSCLLAKEYGAKKTVALINRPELKPMFERIGIDLAISPRLATVSSILQYTSRTEMLSLSVLHDGDARILEIPLEPDSHLIGKRLAKIRFPSSTLVGAIVRGEDEVVIPRGNEIVKVGDTLIVFAKVESIPRLEEMLTKRGGLLQRIF